ncbi:hypothetical protein LPB138_01155 [Urechidicola croceus]|uniref:Uncharacterized protein n=1 Tax=Urechidicola croceus TaxID=1850246 RepID=A0A1D8P460_9FLAO|nr:hypothetical protein LPB138_01155 [Urechidicola croceus]
MYEQNIYSNKTTYNTVYNQCLRFGQVEKFSHFYTTDFPSGKSAAYFNALNHTQTRWQTFEKYELN